MRRRVSISALLFVAALAMPSRAEDELTLHAPQRKSVRPVVARNLAVAFDIAPHASIEAEPNDTLATANAIGLAGVYTATTALGDPASITVDYAGGATAGIADVYALRLDQSAAVAIDLTWESTNADLDLFVFENIEGRLALVDASARDGAAAETVQTRVLQPGLYYIGVAPLSGSSPYNLALSDIGILADCVEDANTMCLNNGRYRVRATWSSGANSGNAGAVRLTTDTGYLWFFNNSNVELVVKVLNACSLNNRFWVFAGGLTDVGVTLTITDMTANVTKTYTNAGGQAFQPITDTSAFDTCSASSCTYGISSGSASVVAAGGTGSFNVTTQTGCNWTATSNVSWITVTAGASGSGSGAVSYSVAANSSSSSRTGTITVGGQTHSVTQSGSAPASYNGTWTGTTAQPGKTMTFDVANNLITRVQFSYRGTGTCTVDGTITVTYTPGRPITGNTFTLNSSGSNSSFTMSGTFHSTSSATGSLNVSFNQSSPPPCTASAATTWTVSK